MLHCEQVNQPIVFPVESLLLTGSMGLDKFGGNAWSGVRDSASNWEKPSLSSEDDCIICMESMGEDQTSLNCKHSFHTKVRKK
jgi:hypothetical protein